MPNLLRQHLSESASAMWRNRLLSLATITAIAIIFLLLNLIFVVSALAKNAVQELNKKLQFTVYLKQEVTLPETEALMAELSQSPYIIPPVAYTSPEQAAELLQENFPSAESFLHTAGQDLPASITITPKNGEAISSIQAMLEQMPYRRILHPLSTEQTDRQKTAFEEIRSNLTQVNRFVNALLLILIAAFVVGGLLLIQNAIHMSIHARRKEIGIMKLLGTPLAVIRGPLVLEGLAYGLFSFVISAALFAIFLQLMTLPPGAINQTFVLNMLFLELLFALLGGGFASFLASRKYIRHRNPFAHA